MPAFLHFYQGAVTRADYWDMPGDELRALMDYCEHVLREMKRG